MFQLALFVCCKRGRSRGESHQCLLGALLVVCSSGPDLGWPGSLHALTVQRLLCCRNFMQLPEGGERCRSSIQDLCVKWWEREACPPRRTWADRLRHAAAEESQDEDSRSFLQYTLRFAEKCTGLFQLGVMSDREAWHRGSQSGFSLGDAQRWAVKGGPGSTYVRCAQTLSPVFLGVWLTEGCPLDRTAPGRTDGGVSGESLPT